MYYMLKAPDALGPHGEALRGVDGGDGEPPEGVPGSGVSYDMTLWDDMVWHDMVCYDVSYSNIQGEPLV